MKKRWKERTVCIMAVLAMLISSVCPAAETESDIAADTEEVFSLWNEDAPALSALTDYVEAVTEEGSESYIPVEDRIAVFDMDGTLMGELYPTYLEYYMLAWRILKDPTYEPDEETLRVGRLLRDCALDNSFPEDMAMQHALAAAKAYAGMTLNEFSDFVTEILLRDVDGFEGMTYGESFYLPMVEVIEYLQENDFKCYVCSGSDRFICRTFIEGMVDIPYENIIGMDVELMATGQGDTDGLDYVFSAGDDLVRTDRLIIKNLKTNKVLQIAQEIGRQPVLSFGNSSGDVSMHNYTINNNVYPSAAFMLIADDDVRDYGNPEKVAELRVKWEESGYNVISMANDWKTIYGEDVVKTGQFRWMDELAEDTAEDTGETAVAAIQSEESRVVVTIDLSGGCSVEFASGAFYLTDGPWSPDTDCDAIGMLLDREVFDEYMAQADASDSRREAGDAVVFEDESGYTYYLFMVGDTGCFMLDVMPGADGDALLARISAQEDVVADIDTIGTEADIAA